MNEQLITYSTAKLAKEKRFNEQCSTTYNISGEAYVHKTKQYNSNFKKITITCTHSNQEFTNEKYSAPTQSLLQKWLREVHNLIVFIAPYIGETANGWSGEIYRNRQFTDIDLKDFNTYEEALESGLQEALKLIQ